MAFLSPHYCDTEIYDLFFEIFNKIDNSAALSSKNNGIAAWGGASLVCFTVACHCERE